MENNYSLAGKVIVVTGGTGTLGNAFVNGIVNAGGSVGILGRNKEMAEERANLINHNGGKAVALIADVLDETQLTAARKKLWDTFGRLDGLVNSAGGNMPESGYTPRGESVIRNTPFKRFDHPDEITGALAWLLSDASAFVTGSMVCVDGGFSIFSGV